MPDAIHQRVTVQPGGRIEIHAPQLPAGALADVTVTVLTPSPPSDSLRSLIGRGQGCYPTPEDADRFLSAERNSWES